MTAEERDKKAQEALSKIVYPKMEDWHTAERFAIIVANFIGRTFGTYPCIDGVVSFIEGYEDRCHGNREDGSKLHAIYYGIALGKSPASITYLIDTKARTGDFFTHAELVTRFKQLDEEYAENYRECRRRFGLDDV